MANLCERCKHAMSAHDNHDSCPQCRVAAGDCSVDPGNPCTTCEGWTRKQWAKLRCSLIDARARAEQRGKQHWTVACPHVEAWILAKPASTSASEISQAGEGDFDDERLVDTPKQHEVQVLVVQSQNGANMATSSTPTAAGTTITAESTAASTASTAAYQEPIVVQLGQATRSVTQGARPEVKYGSQPHFFGQQYMLPAVLRLSSRILRDPSRILRLPSSILHLITITIYLLCQLGLLSQSDIWPGWAVSSHADTGAAFTPTAAPKREAGIRCLES